VLLELLRLEHLVDEPLVEVPLVESLEDVPVADEVEEFAQFVDVLLLLVDGCLDLGAIAKEKVGVLGEDAREDLLLLLVELSDLVGDEGVLESSLELRFESAVSIEVILLHVCQAVEEPEEHLNDFRGLFSEINVLLHLILYDILNIEAEMSPHLLCETRQYGVAGSIRGQLVVQNSDGLEFKPLILIQYLIHLLQNTVNRRPDKVLLQQVLHAVTDLLINSINNSLVLCIKERSALQKELMDTLIEILREVFLVIRFRSLYK